MCPKHLKVTPPDAEEMYLPRTSYIIRVENMINVGCKFGPDDLQPEAWDHLIIFAQEKAWITRKVDDQRREKDSPHPGLSAEAVKEIEKIRKEEGIPAPGHSIFPAVVVKKP